LPAALPVFVGRMPELAALDEVLAPLAGPGVGPAAAPIAVVTGAAGVGKTALALHWAHRHHEDFPDGQLYADLRGWSALGPQAPEVVMAAFLRALGVTTELPSHLDEASGLYRSLLAERRVLVVLDDAVSPEQLRPLLPGGAGCAVLVTSRDRLTGLAVREGARRIPLGGFTSAEGRTLLAHVLGGGAADGADSTEAQRRAGTLLLNACGHLPLAVGIAAAQLRDRPQPDLAAFAVELSTSADRLSALEVGDDRSSLRSAFELSYRALDPAARHLFRRLGLFPGVDIGRAVAAALTGRTEEECDRLLRRLAAANLLIERSSGSYRFHDLLRLFAAESGTREESPAEQRRVLDRWYAWCLHHADRAARVLTPGRRRAPLDPPPGGLDLAVFADPAQATRWCDGQRANLVATVHRAYARGDDEVAWKLPALLWSYLHRSEPQVERVALGQAAVAAAGWLGDLSAHAHGLNDLAQAWSALGELELSRETLQQAEPVAREAGDRCAEGRILIGLGAYHFFGGRYAEARTYYERALALLISDGPGGDGPGTDGPGTDGPGGDGPGTDGPGTDGPESDGPGGDGQDADAWTIDLCRVSLIATHVRLGGYHEARELASSALAHPRAQPNGPVDCALLTNLAAACHGLGRPDEAVTYYERSLGVSSDLPGYPAQRAHALAGLAAAHHALGQTEASRSYRDDAREIYAELPAHQMASILPILRALGYPDLAGDEHER
ncbi:tetratricopeptide repeat protein, partial [Streptomyces sp. FH025]|uniref:ATP-binding protein n=1 Tax=Streptomyces sp. FH025 TaxID=2815937 RepID=UPI001A9F1580